MTRNLLAAGAALIILLAGPAPAAAQQDGDLLPLGHGTLTQDDVALRLRSDELEIRVVPLDERILRLLAPDAYRSLHSLRESRRAAVDSIGRDAGVGTPGAVLVSFYGQQPGARFQPDLLTIAVRGRQLYPIGIIPLSPSFSSQQLEQRQSATAIYLYEDQIPIAEPFTLSYGIASTNEWERKLPTLERERARIGSRVARDTAR